MAVGRTTATESAYLKRFRESFLRMADRLLFLFLQKLLPLSGKVAGTGVEPAISGL